MKKILFSIPFSTVFLVGCTQQTDVDVLQKEVIRLKQQVAQLQEKQEKMEGDISRLSDRVDNVAKVASKNEIALRKIQSFGKVEGVELAEENSPSSLSQLPKEGEEKVKMPENPEELYRYGLDAYYKGKIEQAREIFKEFISKYKDSELYDNALFWIGQTYYTEGNYEKAVQVFDRLIQGCQSGEIVDCNKLPSAMLKKAFALMKMGETEEANRILRQLIDNFPDTEEAEIARRKLGVEG
ncbi:MAG: tetratricopeptide repeat protein [Aquificae bacterium]|nr:tetratricopeptide repeat protein [Aquificota bacterium]